MPESSESSPVIITTVHKFEGGNVFEIKLNRPKVYNAVNAEAAKKLLDAWERFRDEDQLKVAILHGAGDAFCSGADLKAAIGLIGEKSADDFIDNGTGPMGGTRIIQTKPVITMSQGYTYAGGLELFCHGHIRIAEEGATFSVACRRWGVPLVDGGTVFLPRLIGMAHALPLIITGQKIDATEAHRIGLAWEVTPKGKGLERAFDVAKQLCKFPWDAMKGDLTSVILGSGMPLEEALKVEAREGWDAVTSKSMREGIRKFVSGNREWFK